MSSRYIYREGRERGKTGKLLLYKHWCFFTASAKFSSSLKLHLFVFPNFMIFFQFVNVILNIFNIFNKSNYLLQQHYFNHFHFTEKWFSNKKQTKLYKFNGRTETMVSIPLNYHVRAIFQSDKYRTKMERYFFENYRSDVPMRDIKIITEKNPE